MRIGIVTSENWMWPFQIDLITHLVSDRCLCSYVWDGARNLPEKPAGLSNCDSRFTFKFKRLDQASVSQISVLATCRLSSAKRIALRTSVLAQPRQTEHR